MGSLDLLAAAGPGTTLEFNTLAAASLLASAARNELQLLVGRKHLIRIRRKLGHRTEYEVNAGQERVGRQAEKAHRCRSERANVS